MPGPARSRLRDVDLTARDYILHDGSRLMRAALPMVRLSFADPDDSVYFTDRAIRSPDAFSPMFALRYDRGMANLITVFAPLGQGYDGPRRLPVTFHKKPVSPRRPATVPADPYDAKDAASETASIDALTVHVPRSIRQVTLLHWVTHKPDVWLKAQPTDMLYTSQWLDTHAHPAWFYPGAAKTKRKFLVLLLIRAPVGTPMLRIPRHSPQAHRINRLVSGEWTHSEANPTESEVRLPPGRFRVEMHPTMERFAGRDVLVVQLDFESGRFAPSQRP